MMNPSPDNFCEGDYVQVIGAPDPWESSGEDDSDRNAYIGHIGVVMETSPIDDQMFALVRFPGSATPDVGQRNIECEKLKFISHPEYYLPEACFE